MAKHYEFLDIYGVSRFWDYICYYGIDPLRRRTEDMVGHLSKQMQGVVTSMNDRVINLKNEIGDGLDEHILTGKWSADGGKGHSTLADHDKVYLSINTASDAVLKDQLNIFASYIGKNTVSIGKYPLDIRYVSIEEYESGASKSNQEADEKYVWKKYHLDKWLDGKTNFPSGYPSENMPCTADNMRDHDDVYLRLNGKVVGDKSNSSQYKIITLLPETNTDALNELSAIFASGESVSSPSTSEYINKLPYPLDFRYYTKAQIANCIVNIKKKIAELEASAGEGNSSLAGDIDDLKKRVKALEDIVNPSDTIWDNDDIDDLPDWMRNHKHSMEDINGLLEKLEEIIGGGDIDLSNYYTKDEANDRFALKDHTHDSLGGNCSCSRMSAEQVFAAYTAGMNSETPDDSKY